MTTTKGETMTTVYYLGDQDDLAGLTRSEVEPMTVEYYHQAEDAFEEWLGEIYGTVEICGLTFDAGDALRKLDPIAFRCGVSDHTAEVDLDDYPADADDE